ncbi:MAG: hypothetical protein EOO38_08620 [Cytophagaceae bacterium]|nr:MAG: hypothetical protein EOO38_08620 [Cytophagaceae bacterium]
MGKLRSSLKHALNPIWGFHPLLHRSLLRCRLPSISLRIMLELPLEVWAKIIAHLAQETPLPGDNRDFDVPGQNNLCNIMRLNSVCPILSSPAVASSDVQTFHDLTAPYLYEKVGSTQLVLRAARAAVSTDVGNDK